MTISIIYLLRHFPKFSVLPTAHMEAAKDLLRRAVELDTAMRYSEALVCYEQGIQNLLRAMGGERARLVRTQLDTPLCQSNFAAPARASRPLQSAAQTPRRKTSARRLRNSSKERSRSRRRSGKEKVGS